MVKSNQCQCVYEIVPYLLFSWMLEIVIFYIQSLHHVIFVFRFVNLPIIMSTFYLTKPRSYSMTGWFLMVDFESLSVKRQTLFLT